MSKLIATMNVTLDGFCVHTMVLQMSYIIHGWRESTASVWRILSYREVVEDKGGVVFKLS
jgi:hypothetical protein